MALSYSEYPRTIEKNKIYFYRSKRTLRILPCRVVGCSGDKYTVSTASIDALEVERSEILTFDPCSRLFQHLMRLNAYRESKEIRQALRAEGLDPTKFMKYKPDKASKEDANIEESTFVFEMQRFISKKNTEYRAVVQRLLAEPLPGTVGLRLYNLYKIVCANGGMDNVIHLQIWKRLFFRYMEKTNTSYVMRTFYKKYLYEFELARRCSEESTLDFNYVYKKGDHVIFVGKCGQRFCGKVVAYRNRGLNVYYIKFLGWNEENNEWISEDILQHCDGNVKACSSRYLAPSKSSKANKFVDDPVTWEKHRHGSNFSVKLYNSSADMNSSSTNIRVDDLYREEVDSYCDASLASKGAHSSIRDTRRKKRHGVSCESVHVDARLRCSIQNITSASDEGGIIRTLAEICEEVDTEKRLLSRIKEIYENENLFEVLSEYNFAIYKMWRGKRKGFNCS